MSPLSLLKGISTDSPRKINVYGDSHARYFKLIPELLDITADLKKRYTIDVNVFNGATILGLRRRKTTLSVNIQIDESIEGSIAVFNFGQVDVELGFYYRQIVKGEAITAEEFGQRLRDTFIEYLEGLRNKASMIIVKGLNPPALIPEGKAAKYTGRIISERQPSSERKVQLKKLTSALPDVMERTAISRRYNEQLETACEGKGFAYFDIWDKVIDTSTGLLDEVHVPSGKNHHVSDSAWVRRQHWMEVARLIQQCEA